VGFRLKGRRLRMKVVVEELVFLLNLMDDFLEFMDCPDQEQYLSRHPLVLATSWREAFPNKRRSSANSK
jgi:hypothetical protein